MAEAVHTPAAQFSRIFRKAGICLYRGQVALALAALREGEALALSLGNDEKLALFREEVTRCEERLKNSSIES